MRLARNGVALAAIGIVFLLIIPPQPWLLDMLFIINMSVSMGILLLTIYNREALQFSAFPSMLLMTTLFRVALNVSSTRLILGHGGEAGNIIKAFGNFVVGGNAIVGFIVFIVIIIVQFVVITKGAERVAEVSARFTLDAMPGKQMAIDADLNSGLINEEEARDRRKNIAREADFYGAMDGASKFVKGDAIVAILVVVINLIGGTIIGMVGGGSDFSTILKTYTIATVGDGLVSQLCALLISTATAMIVTRAASDNSLNEDVSRQMFSQPIMLMITGGVLMAMCVIPGFPWWQLLLYGGLLFFLGYRMRAKAQEPAPKQEAQPVMSEIEFYRNPENIYSLLNVEPVKVEFGYSLVPLIDVSNGGNFVDRVVMFRRQFAMDMGMVVPSVVLRDNIAINPNEYIIKLKGEQVARGEVLVDFYLAFDAGAAEGEIEGIDTIEPAFGIPAKWITESQKEMAEVYGYTVIDPLSVIVTHLSQIIKTHAYELLSRQDVNTLLETVKKSHKALVDETIPAIVSVSDLHKVLCNLLREHIPIRDLPTIIETMGDYAPSIKDMDLVTEYVRQALKRTITRRYADDGSLKVITLDPELESMVMGNIKKSDQGTYITMEPETMHRIISSLSGELTNVRDQITEPIILSSPVVRVYFKKMIEQFMPDATVLSFNEIENSVQIQAIGSVRV